jgi:hypothetical protein
MGLKFPGFKKPQPKGLDDTLDSYRVDTLRVCEGKHKVRLNLKPSTNDHLYFFCVNCLWYGYITKSVFYPKMLNRPSE